VSRVVVLGGSGAMGARVSEVLRGRGHDVAAASRATGVDVTTGVGLDDVLSGAETVLDCLNVVTLSRRTAVSFFGGAAARVAAAAERAGVGHVVCLSIVNVSEPAVRRATGYYGGKAAQEEAYSAGTVPLTLARTTAWFSLAETFLGQIRLGPVALVPGIRLRPVHPAAVATFLADAVEAGPPVAGGPAVLQLAGPEPLDSAAMARAVARARHPGVRVVRVPVPMAGLREGLVPHGEVPVDRRRFAEWLVER
jgi:uncharacterized protein YbjT (DUF2867 family)